MWPKTTNPSSSRAGNLVRLLVSCSDRPGIVAAVSSFLYECGANIVTSSQYSTTGGMGGRFFLRMQFEKPDDAPLERIEREFTERVGEKFEMESRLWIAGRPKKVAVLVSRYDHCMLDLLWRWRRGELEAEISLVASNHPDLREDVEAFGLPYHHVPVDRDRKAEAEGELLEVLDGKADLVVLARYMQILSGEFLQSLDRPVINIHHSFLPAFPGAGPYERAKERGVKLIGATSHYVTEEVDAGPIIEQDVIRVDHSHDSDDMGLLGSDIERAVLARAVKWHCEDRVLLNGDTTVVF